MTFNTYYGIITLATVVGFKPCYKWMTFNTLVEGDELPPPPPPKF